MFLSCTVFVRDLNSFYCSLVHTPLQNQHNSGRIKAKFSSESCIIYNNDAQPFCPAGLIGNAQSICRPDPAAGHGWALSDHAEGGRKQPEPAIQWEGGLTLPQTTCTGKGGMAQPQTSLVEAWEFVSGRQ